MNINIKKQKKNYLQTQRPKNSMEYNVRGIKGNMK